MADSIVTIDFETEPIDHRPHYPPKPVGVSVKEGSGRSKYLAWGHTTGNNTTQEKATRILDRLFKDNTILMHNAKFDLAVAEERMGIPLPTKFHDTMPLIFLDNPHAADLSLKGTATRELGIKPLARDTMAEWLIKNQPVPGKRITPTSASTYTAFAPGHLAAKYAKSDADMTYKLFRHFKGDIRARAYETELKLIPILHHIEKQGIRVNHAALKRDIKKLAGTIRRIDQWLSIELRASKDLNVDSGAQLARALIQSGQVKESEFPITEKGNIRTSKDVLAEIITNVPLKAILNYRSALTSCLKTFMMPWFKMADESGGYIYCHWNSCRSREGMGLGARTGRFSSSPNFQNIPKPFTKPENLPLDKLPPIPKVRGYIIPSRPRDVLINRDYSQQELRVLAHFEGGPLLNAYKQNPWLDVHEHARQLIHRITGKMWDRKPVKNTGFGILYGMGLGKLAEQSKITVAEAKKLRDAYLAGFSGIKSINQDMRSRAASDEPYYTWAGRRYFCEPSKLIHGQRRTFEYKMINVLIQGSAADCTKQAIINYWERKKPDEQLLLTVHDEIMASVPYRLGKFGNSMNRLREAMQDVDFDVQMLSEGKYSQKNWACMVPFDSKGKKLYAR